MDIQKSTSSTGNAGIKREHTLPDRPVEIVPISELLPAAESPRLHGENAEHVRTLANSDAVLPPILVDRRSRRVIDGSHRLKAAMLRGEDSIQVIYFDGIAEDAFVAAVEANTTHGLPLSLADRKAAAARILGIYPGWSDRAIARVTGLAAKTVASIRRPTDDAHQLDRRVGADGRVRPVDGANGRMRAAEVIRNKPHATLREIAETAGVSPMTAGDVRDRLKRGDAPTVSRRPRATLTATGAPRRGVGTKAEPQPDPTAILLKLRSDPSLRQTELGRALLRRLDVQVRGVSLFLESSERVPCHCLYTLAELAHALAFRWHSLAEELERAPGAGTDASRGNAALG